MVVDFEFKSAPAYRLATIGWKGPWKESKIRTMFGTLAAWTKKSRVKTGKWLFWQVKEGVWRVGIQVSGKARGDSKVRLRTLPKSRVATVVFDPDQVSPRVVYHGLNDWLKWRRKDKEIKSVGMYREVYDGNPWTDRKAWSRTAIQVVVR